MSVNIKLGEKTISGVDSIRVEDADTAGTYDVFSMSLGNTVSFVANDTTILQVSVPSGGTVNEPADPSAEGYSLVGWFTQENGGGSEVFFPYTPTADITLYAYFVEETFITFSSDEPFDFGVYNKTKNWDGTLYTSTDKANWTIWDGTTDVSAAKHRSNKYYLSLRGSNNTYITGVNPSLKQFVVSGLFYCNGNIENILDYSKVSNNQHPTMSNYCFSYLFYQTGIISPPKLPATTLSMNCYANMFDSCTSLTNPPALPAETLSGSCYANMFYSCSQLTEAPTLPATTLANYCYSSMFYGCIRLKTAPKLPATTLANNCYTSMFRECRSITEAPTLPATTLAASCYGSMFQGCQFSVPPALPATTLANYCYSSMFSQCTNLICLPALPATTLANNCYGNMFYACSKIKLSTTQTGDYQTEYRIPTSGTGTVGSSSLNNMFNSTGGTFTGSPTINTTYYTSNTIIPATSAT